MIRLVIKSAPPNLKSSVLYSISDLTYNGYIILNGLCVHHIVINPVSAGLDGHFPTRNQSGERMDTVSFVAKRMLWERVKDFVNLDEYCDARPSYSVTRLDLVPANRLTRMPFVAKASHLILHPENTAE